MSFFSASTWKSKPPQATLARCGSCGLYKNCTSPKLAAVGTGSRRVLFVGDAPGVTDDQHGQHAQGDGGRVLRSVLAGLNLSLDECWYTTAAICHPRDGLQILHIESCRPNLTNTIRELKPAVIVLLGIDAVRALVPTEWEEGLGDEERWAGWAVPSPLYNAWLCPTYSPDFVLRNREDPVLIRIMAAQVVAALELERVPVPNYELDKLKATIDVITDPRLMRKRMKDLAKKEGVSAVDYETTGLKPEPPEQRIVCASFCYNGTDTFAGPITPENQEALSRVLLNEKLRKVAANLKFEERWTWRRLGHGVAGWLHDTMLGAHVLDNREGICGLKFQTYLRFGIADYSSHIAPYFETKTANGLNRITELPIVDVLTYCGLDSLFEFRHAEPQMGQIYGKGIPR